MVVSIPRIEAEYYGERARVFLRDAMYPECRAYAERALVRETRNPDLYYYLGESQHFLAMQGSQSQAAMELHIAAANAFSKGLEAFPQDLRLLLKLGRTLDALGRFDEAEGIYQPADGHEQRHEQPSFFQEAILWTDQKLEWLPVQGSRGCGVVAADGQSDNCQGNHRPFRDTEATF